MEAWSEQIGKKHLPHRFRQVVAGNRARLDTGWHQVHKPLHLAILDEHVCVYCEVFKRGEFAQGADVAGGAGAGRKFEGVEGRAGVFEERADGVETPPGAVVDVTEGVEVAKGLHKGLEAFDRHAAGFKIDVL